MQIAVLSAAVLVYALVVLAFRRLAQNADRVSVRLDAVAKIGEAREAEGAELSRPFAERFLKPLAEGFVRRLEGLLPQQNNPKLANSLRQAGIGLRPGEYNALRLVAALALGVFLALLAALSEPPQRAVELLGGRGGARILLPALLGLGGAAAGLILMRYVLAVKTRTRKQAIQRQLPEVLDLLSVSVEAGLGFDAALQRVSERARGPLITELDATYREITLGRPRPAALRNFEQRCGLEEIKSFVSAIIQAEQLGISLKNVLKAQAHQMRLLKRQRVEEKAMKAPVKIILPLVAFVFPVLFIILLGPAVINLIGMGGILG